MEEANGEDPAGVKPGWVPQIKGVLSTSPAILAQYWTAAGAPLCRLRRPHFRFWDPETQPLHTAAPSGICWQRIPLPAPHPESPHVLHSGSLPDPLPLNWEAPPRAQ